MKLEDLSECLTFFFFFAEADKTEELSPVHSPALFDVGGMGEHSQEDVTGGYRLP